MAEKNEKSSGKTENKDTSKEFTDGLKDALDDVKNKKILAGILAILLGWAGVHKFILGYKKEGFILLGISIAGILLARYGLGLLTTLTGLVGLIEGILYLIKSDDDFYQTYQVGRKPWF